MRYCLNCGIGIESKRRTAKFCTVNCRVKYHNRKDDNVESLRIDYPLLHYFGGKWTLAQWVISQMPEHRIYVEPFGGAGSVLLQKERSQNEVFNDLDNAIINLMQVIRNADSFLMLRNRLNYTLFSRAEYDLSLETTDDPIEQAARTIVRSYFSYGSHGLFRKTGFRTNMLDTSSAKQWSKYIKHIDKIRDRLMSVQIESRPAGDVIAGHDTPDTLFYVDPPYVHDTRDNTRVYRHEMTDDQHSELADILHNVQGMVMLSGYPSALYDRLYPDWQTVSTEAQTEGHRDRVEYLWFNPSAYEALHGETQLTLWIE